MTADGGGVVDRIRGLDVPVRWTEGGGSGAWNDPPLRTAEPVRPLSGPLAGCAVECWLDEEQPRHQPAWWSRLLIERQARPPAVDVAIAPAGAGRRTWTEHDAVAAITGLMHGQTRGMAWRPIIRGRTGRCPTRRGARWRPMSELAGWIEKRTAR